MATPSTPEPLSLVCLRCNRSTTLAEIDRWIPHISPPNDLVIALPVCPACGGMDLRQVTVPQRPRYTFSATESVALMQHVLSAMEHRTLGGNN